MFTEAQIETIKSNTTFADTFYNEENDTNVEVYKNETHKFYIEQRDGVVVDAYAVEMKLHNTMMAKMMGQINNAA